MSKSSISWSAMRKALEQDNICDSLKGRIQYFQTQYRLGKTSSHHGYGRVSIRLDGKEIFQSDWNSAYEKEWAAVQEMRKSTRDTDWKEAERLARNLGGVYSFSSSFYAYHNNSIDDSLASPDAVVRLFAILDRRVGKRRLQKILPEVEKQPEWLQVFFKLRLDAEGIQ